MLGSIPLGNLNSGPLLPKHNRHDRSSSGSSSPPAISSTGRILFNLRRYKQLQIITLFLVVLFLLVFYTPDRASHFELFPSSGSKSSSSSSSIYLESTNNREKSTFPSLSDIGRAIGFTPEGTFGVLGSGEKSWVKLFREGLTSLGIEADEAFFLGETEPVAYISQLETFIQMSFPTHLKEDILTSVRTFWNRAAIDPEDVTADTLRKLPAMVEYKNVWQTDKKTSDADGGSWTAKNPGWKWELMDDEKADEWLRQTFGIGSQSQESKSTVEAVWNDLELGILKSDMWRYLVLLIEGGVYTDTDTTCLRPVHQWGRGADTYPGSHSYGLPSMIIGVEADVGSREDWHDWWARPIQISQWTLSSAPHHPILVDVIRRIHHSTTIALSWLAHRESLAVSYEAAGNAERAKKTRSISLLESKGVEGEDEKILGKGVSVMEWTGPGVWTDAVMAYLKARHQVTWPTFKNIQRPLRIGEIVVLPVTGFSPGVGLFGAQNQWHEEAMVLHSFSGSWKTDG